MHGTKIDHLGRKVRSVPPKDEFDGGRAPSAATSSLTRTNRRHRLDLCVLPAMASPTSCAHSARQREPEPFHAALAGKQLAFAVQPFGGPRCSDAAGFCPSANTSARPSAQQSARPSSKPSTCPSAEHFPRTCLVTSQNTDSQGPCPSSPTDTEPAQPPELPDICLSPPAVPNQEFSLQQPPKLSLQGAPLQWVRRSGLVGQDLVTPLHGNRARRELNRTAAWLTQDLSQPM